MGFCTDIAFFLSGFEREDVWGYRALEPNRCCISSIALVLLKTGITHANPADPTPQGVNVDHAQMGTAQKLLLFWRKPAVSRFSFVFLRQDLIFLSVTAQMLVGWP